MNPTVYLVQHQVPFFSTCEILPDFLPSILFSVERSALHTCQLHLVQLHLVFGVIIDNSLSFKAHVKEICQKVNRKVSILRRIRKFIPLDVMIKLYKAFILPHFEYASPLFIGLSKGLSAKLESTNAIALLNYYKSTAYEELLKTAHIKSLEH